MDTNRYIQDRLAGREDGHHYSCPHIRCSDWMTELRHSKALHCKSTIFLRLEEREPSKTGGGLKSHNEHFFCSSLLSSSSNQTAERYLICHNSNAFAQDIRERGWRGEKIIKKKVLKFELWVGRTLVRGKKKQKNNSSRLQTPRKRRGHSRQGFPQLPLQRYVVRRTKAEQGRREAEGQILGQDSASSGVPGA